MTTVTTSLTTELVASVSDSSIPGAVYVSEPLPETGYAIEVHPATKAD